MIAELWIHVKRPVGEPFWKAGTFYLGLHQAGRGKSTCLAVNRCGPTGKEARKLDPLVLCEIPQRQSFLSGGEMILKEGGIKK